MKLIIDLYLFWKYIHAKQIKLIFYLKIKILVKYQIIFLLMKIIVSINLLKKIINLNKNKAKRVVLENYNKINIDFKDPSIYKVLENIN